MKQVTIKRGKTVKIGPITITNTGPSSRAVLNIEAPEEMRITWEKEKEPDTRCKIEPVRSN